MGDFKLNAGTSASRQATFEGTEEVQTFISDITNPEFLITYVVVVAVILLIVLPLAFCWATFVSGPVRVGSCRYFMESRRKMQSAGVGRVFYAFESGGYWNTVKTMLMRSVFTFLWSLLLVIPGIVKSYAYYLVPYILQDDPKMKYRDALKLSSDMMDGYKWELFVLHWSFIGWEILGMLSCGIGLAFLAPYKQATYAEFYAERRKDKWPAVEMVHPDDPEAWNGDNLHTDFLR